MVAERHQLAQLPLERMSAGDTHLLQHGLRKQKQSPVASGNGLQLTPARRQYLQKYKWTI